MARTGYCLLTVTHAAGEAWVEVEWTHDEAIIQTLKRLVPAADRTWDAERGHWLIRARHTATLQRLARSFRVAEWHEGNRVTDLISGRQREQLTLFGDE